MAHNDSPQRHLDRARISRRAVTTGALWSAPVITLATAAPAMASSLPTTPASITANWVTDSFRCNNDTFDTPDPDGYYAPVAMVVTVPGTVTSLTCTVTCEGGTGGGIEFWGGNANMVPQRGNTVWALSNPASLALDGWSTTTPTGTIFKSATITRGMTTGTVLLRPVLEAIRDLSVPGPITFSFTTVGGAAPAQVVAMLSMTSPYITGSP